MTSQRKEVFAWSRLVSDRSKHWQKTLTNPCVIFYFYFYKETKKPRFTGMDLTVCSRMIKSMISQHEQQVKF